MMSYKGKHITKYMFIALLNKHKQHKVNSKVLKTLTCVRMKFGTGRRCWSVISVQLCIDSLCCPRDTVCLFVDLWNCLWVRSLPVDT